MSNELPINARQIKRQSKLLLAELRALALSPSVPTLSLAQEMIARIWRQDSWQDALVATREGGKFSSEELSPGADDLPTPGVSDAIGFDRKLSIEPIADLIAHVRKVGADVLSIELTPDSVVVGGEFLTSRTKLSMPTHLLQNMPKDLYSQLHHAWVGLGHQNMVRKVGDVAFAIIDRGAHSEGIRVEFRLNGRPSAVAIRALGMPQRLMDAIDTAFRKPRSIILVSSATASGKSQTALALKNAYPDAVVIDEFRQYSASWYNANPALRTGATVIAVVHASSAEGAISRLGCVAPEGEDPISREHIALSIFQVRVNAYCGGCAITQRSLTTSALRDATDFSARHGLSLSRQRFRSSTGCEQCAGIRPDSIAVFSHIANGTAPDESSLKEHALQLIENGIIDYTSVIDICDH